MLLALVVQEKNINVVVGLYKKIRIEINKATDNPNIDKKNFLDLFKKDFEGNLLRPAPPALPATSDPTGVCAQVHSGAGGWVRQGRHGRAGRGPPTVQ